MFDASLTPSAQQEELLDEGAGLPISRILSWLAARMVAEERWRFHRVAKWKTATSTHLRPQKSRCRWPLADYGSPMSFRATHLLRGDAWRGSATDRQMVSKLYSANTWEVDGSCAMWPTRHHEG